MWPSKILIIQSGSIATAKSTLVISSLVKSGSEVQIVATQSALEFVGEATLEGLTGKKVFSNLYQPGEMMSHIHLMRWAEMIVILPATANFINKLAQGIGDDLASTLMLAHQFDKPVHVFPAMNSAMWLHPKTQESIKILQSWGYLIHSPGSGQLACGEEGPGRLLEPNEILEILKNSDSLTFRDKNKVPSPFHQKFSKKKILVTFGGTQESIDGVRFISNFSTGKTGQMICEHLALLGHEIVTLQNIQVSESPLKHLMTINLFSDFTSFYEKIQILLKEFRFDAIIHLAALSDYSIESLTVNSINILPSQNLKIDSNNDIKINLKKNPKLIHLLKKMSSQSTKIIGFKLTKNLTESEILPKVENLLKLKQVDLVIQNDLSLISQNKHPFQVFNNEMKIIGNGNTKFELCEYLAKEVENDIST